ncbi:MAG: flagellar basal body-associated FliL family protein [bacterium]|nr:flagellar basal body-associated FliL family protein [bacterium]
MKKNLMSVLILALLVVNLVLTAITMISIVPSAKKSNALIDEICTALNLELASGRNANLSNVKIEDIDSFTLADSLTINLKDSEDGSEHYAIVNVTVSMDKKNEDYEKKRPVLEAQQNLIRGITNDVICKYTKEEFKNSPEAAQKEILEKLQGLFDSSFIIGVSFPQMTCD